MTLGLKKLLILVLVFVLVLTALPATARAEFDPDSISTPYVVLMDAETGAVLFEKNAHTQTYPASTTKIMTCILAIEQADSLTGVVTVGDTVESKGSLMNILPHEEIPLIDLIYGTMLVSGNDAAAAIAEYIFILPCPVFLKQPNDISPFKSYLPLQTML